MYARRWLLLILLALNYLPPLLALRWLPRFSAELAAFGALPLWSLAVLLLVSAAMRRNAREAMWNMDTSLGASVRSALQIIHADPTQAARELRVGLRIHDRHLGVAAEVSHG